MLSIKSSITALIAQRALDRTSDQVSRVYERLSSGQRINRASDDAAGLAVSSKLSADSRIYTQAMRNVNDAVSAFAIADSTLGEGTSILMRLRELATQAANGSFSLAQRRSLNEEAQKLREEYNRMFASTSFNGQNLLDGRIGSFNVHNGREGSSYTSFRLGESSSHWVGTGGYEADTTSFAFAGAAQGTSITTGDFDEDGDIDMISLSDGRIYRNDGQGNFTAGTGTGIATTGTAREAMDVNGDGHLDLVYTGAGNNTYYKAGNGNGTFGSQRLIANGTDVELGDFDGDGDLDAVGVGGGGYVGISTNNGGTFSVTASYTTSVADFFLGVRVGDVDSDGRLDVLAGTSDNRLVLLAGNGNGTLGAGTAFGTGSYSNSYYFTDVNGDGINDYIVDSQNVRLGLGGGQFGSAIVSDGVLSNSYFSLRDVNNDGLLDMSDTFGYVAYGQGDGRFIAASTENLPSPSNQVSAVMADFDGDGVADWLYGDGDDSNYHLVISNAMRTGNLHSFDLVTRDDALSAMSLIDSALLRLQRERGELGASQSRLASTLLVLSATRENYLDARSRIVDADIAQDSAELTRLGILREAGAAVLSQANQVPALALTLLASR